ncbi:PREDICTED: uncharacterized protein LOC104607324 [Nelumbo nucifera]|uniref:Uncharacterized protein n=2 Tax=Nelumbo nucifera TaxID=4432 RepID=A0A822YMU3_NELNU|nr:PREDICTED: uncharacterized protein LOC104607324 [Nelumbo nucifera]DAD32335.1 TPA_asm: hypothetical protein HUJ06_011186 [Nelumbo nucifera]
MKIEEETTSTEVVKKEQCGCCGMSEECTVGYIRWVKERFGGIWVCGLCEEAIKDEQARLGVGVEVALRVHTMFRETANADPAIQIARSILQLLKRIMSATASSGSDSAPQPTTVTQPPSF